MTFALVSLLCNCCAGVACGFDMYSVQCLHACIVFNRILNKLPFATPRAVLVSVLRYLQLPGPL